MLFPNICEKIRQYTGHQILKNDAHKFFKNILENMLEERRSDQEAREVLFFKEPVRFCRKKNHTSQMWEKIIFNSVVARFLLYTHMTEGSIPLGRHFFM